MLTLYKPRRTLIEELFDDFWGAKEMDVYSKTYSPNLDVRETKDQVIIEAEVAGMKKEDIKVVYEKGVLKISGERKDKKEEKDEHRHYTEIRRGSFERVVPLNEKRIKTDSIKADYKDGLLTLTIDKQEEAKPKQIEVKVK